MTKGGLTLPRRPLPFDSLPPHTSTPRSLNEMRLSRKPQLLTHRDRPAAASRAAPLALRKSKHAEEGRPWPMHVNARCNHMAEGKRGKPGTGIKSFNSSLNASSPADRHRRGTGNSTAPPPPDPIKLIRYSQYAVRDVAHIHHRPISTIPRLSPEILSHASPQLSPASHTVRAQ